LLLRATSNKEKTSLDYSQGRFFDTTEDVYQATKDHMMECLDELEPSVSPNQSFAPGAVKAESSAFSLSHLPQIKLPFDRSYSEWENFYDCFTALIIKNKAVSGFARMHYLASSLKGQALDAISNIAVTADNVFIAWEALTKRFENK